MLNWVSSRTKMKGLSTTTSFSPANEALKKTSSIPVAAAPSVPFFVTSMTASWRMLLIPEIFKKYFYI